MAEIRMLVAAVVDGRPDSVLEIAVAVASAPSAALETDAAILQEHLELASCRFRGSVGSKAFAAC